VTIPLRQQLRVGAYILSQKIRRVKRYPVVLMLEPLFRCNLACQGCGKIDYEDDVLNQRLSVQECLDAVDECGAPIVSIPGGEPLIHKEIDQIVKGIIAKKRFVYLCTNALLLEKKLSLFEPSPYLTFSVHLDGLEEEHDKAVDQPGTFKRAVSAIRAARAKGFRVNVNCTLFDQMTPDQVAAFFNYCTEELDVEGITVSPGYAYERAPNQEHFLNRAKTKNLFREIFKRQGKTKWTFSQSPLFMDFLAGNQTYKCTPWGNPTRNIFGWQKPCYLLGEGYTKSFKELMEETDWDSYGTGNYEKCADCMVHCGYEPSAIDDTFRRPLQALKVALRGPRTDGPLAPEIPLDNQRPAQFVFEGLIQRLSEQTKPGAEQDTALAQNANRLVERQAEADKSRDLQRVS
jgi:hopanoid biosynthesis associated radical SAM protein HpnH